MILSRKLLTRYRKLKQEVLAADADDLAPSRGPLGRSPLRGGGRRLETGSRRTTRPRSCTPRRRRSSETGAGRTLPWSLSDTPFNVGFYEAAGRVKSPSCFSVWGLWRSVFGRDGSALRSHEVLSVFYSRSSRARAYALAGAGGDSRGGGAIYAAALRQQPSQHSRSPTHRTCARARRSRP